MTKNALLNGFILNYPRNLWGGDKFGPPFFFFLKCQILVHEKKIKIFNVRFVFA